MVIYNVKINGKKWAKIAMVVMTILIMGMVGIVAYQVFGKEPFTLRNEKRIVEVQEITPQSYTNILKEVHENMDAYLGQKIKFTGYIYRLYDFERENFVLARDMLISSDFQTVVVGFYCHCPDAITFRDNTWVEIEGTITKGDYHGDIPLIEVTQIHAVEEPNETCVYPPSDNFIPTSSIVYQQN